MDRFTRAASSARLALAAGILAGGRISSPALETLGEVGEIPRNPIRSRAGTIPRCQHCGAEGTDSHAFYARQKASHGRPFWLCMSCGKPERKLG